MACLFKYAVVHVYHKFVDMKDSSTAAYGLTQILLVWDVLELTLSFIVALMFVPLCYDFMLIWVLGLYAMY